MVLFDLNNLRGSVISATPIAYQANKFQGVGLAPVKSVKRLSSHPWPFSVKHSMDQHSPDYRGASRTDSSFVT